MKINIINFDDVKDISIQDYFSNESFAEDMFNIKYSLKKQDGNKETPAEVFLRIASGLSEMETDDNKKIKYRDIWFSLLWEGWWRPGGSIISGVGSSERVSLNNCTYLPIEGDSLDDISECRKNLMKCAALRQGLGILGDPLRPRGSIVNNSAKYSTGSIPWLDDLVAIGKKVGQMGRMPALLAALGIHHPDIEEFISCKDDLEFMNNANLSVQISDAFMDAVEKDEEWELKFDIKPSGEKIVKTINARKLFTKIAEHAKKSAEPGVQYIDSMRKGSMVQCIANATGDDTYRIEGTNACSEKPLAKYSVCNLASINMEMFSINEEDYKNELENIIPPLVRLSDNVVSYELYNNLSPVKKQAYMVEQLREIGLGITNLHGWLLKQNIAYDSDEAIERTEKFFKYYSYIVFKTSIELGKEKGNAPGFDLVKDKNEFMNSIYFKNIVNEFYNGDITKVTNMRNMAHMSIAPTGSLSNSFPHPCISSGVEPVIGLYYWRKTRAINENSSYTYYFVIPNRLKEFILNKMDKDTDDYKQLLEFPGSLQDDKGEIGKSLIKIINKYIEKDFFKPAHEIDYLKKIKLISRLYNWLDSAISCTYNLAEFATVKDIETIYMESYKQGCRAVSVYVDKCREGILIFENPNIEKIKKQNNIICNERPKYIVYNCAPKRPNEVLCNIHQVSIKGTIWIVLVGLMNDLPFEIFCGQTEDLYIPKTCKNGKITKQSKGKYSLEVTIRKSIVEYKNLAHVLMTNNERALTRLLSLNLRHGVPLQFIVDQLKKSNGDITAFATAISRVLSIYIKDIDYLYKDGEKICPMCGKETMIFRGGCIECIECKYSKCG